MNSIFYEWPEALAWIVFNDPVEATVVREDLESCKSGGDHLNLTLIWMADRGNEIRERRDFPLVRDSEALLIRQLSRGTLGAEGKPGFGALPETVPANAWWNAEIRPDETGFNLYEKGSASALFFDVRIEARGVRKLARAVHGYKAPPPAPKTRIEAPTNASEMFRQRLEDALKRGVRYSRADDEAWGQSVGINRQAIRALRDAHSTEQQKRGGRPSKQGK